MDFSALFIIPIAAVIALAIALVSQWSNEMRKHSFLLSLSTSFLLSVFLLRPWSGIAATEWLFLLLSIGLIFIWTAGGTVVGMLVAKVVGFIGSAFRRSK